MGITLSGGRTACQTDLGCWPSMRGSGTPFANQWGTPSAPTVVDGQPQDRAHQRKLDLGLQRGGVEPVGAGVLVKGEHAVLCTQRIVKSVREGC